MFLTGWRPQQDELALGVEKRTKDILLSLADTSGVVGPQKQALDVLRKNEDQWRLFLEALKFIPFFARLLRASLCVYLFV